MPCRFDAVIVTNSDCEFQWVKDMFTLSVMDHYQTIANNFQETIAVIAQSVDQLAEPIQQASEAMTHALLNDRKILCCGDGSNAALCQLFVCNLLNHFEQDRPALPAFSLANDAATLTAITSSYSFNETYSKQIHALGQSGDVLLTLSNQKHNGSIIQAIRAAHERKLVVVCLNSSAGTDISSLMLPEDIELVVNAQRPVRITEIHTMLLHHFCELIDFALFGTHSP